MNGYTGGNTGCVEMCCNGVFLERGFPDVSVVCRGNENRIAYPETTGRFAFCLKLGFEFICDLDDGTCKVAAVYPGEAGDAEVEGSITGLR